MVNTPRTRARLQATVKPAPSSDPFMASLDLTVAALAIMGALLISFLR